LECDPQKAQLLEENIADFLANAFSFDVMKDDLASALDRQAIEGVENAVIKFLKEHQEEFKQASKRFKLSAGDEKIVNWILGNGKVGKKDKSINFDGLGFELKDKKSYCATINNEEIKLFNNEWRIADLRCSLAYFALYFDYYSRLPENNHIDFDEWMGYIDNAYQQKMQKKEEGALFLQMAKEYIQKAFELA
jgi:hypothetical protein